MLKRLCSVFLCTLLIIACIPLSSVSASSQEVEVYSITASPANAVVNDIVTYTVTTSTAANSVRILNPDKSIHTAAYINAGFTDYSDNGSVRTWNITKRVQVTFNGHKRAVASGSNFDGVYTSFASAPYTDALTVVINSGDTPDEYVPIVEEKIEAEHGLIAGSFLQGWLCRDWSASRWESEFAGMKEVGMDSLIIQSVYDWALTAGSDAQNWETYSTNTKYSLYPTQISAISGANCSADQIENMLSAAKKYDMKVYIGLLSDDRWWKYGWNELTAPDGTKNGENTYFDGWCTFNGEIQAQMVEEIWNRYSENYADQIAGFYYYNEIWNLNATLPAASVESYTNSLAKNMNLIIDAINECCPQKEFMISPYFNISYGTAQEYADWWTEIYGKVSFRKGDIMAPQDTVGSYGESSIPVRIGEWIAALAEATKATDTLKFWVNNETFTASYAPTEISVVIKQIEASDAYTDTHILFSWNHYYNPAYNSSFQSNHDLLVNYVKSRAAEE